VLLSRRNNRVAGPQSKGHEVNVGQRRHEKLPVFYEAHIVNKRVKRRVGLSRDNRRAVAAHREVQRLLRGSGFVVKYRYFQRKYLPLRSFCRQNRNPALCHRKLVRAPFGSQSLAIKCLRFHCFMGQNRLFCPLFAIKAMDYAV